MCKIPVCIVPDVVNREKLPVACCSLGDYAYRDHIGELATSAHLMCQDVIMNPATDSCSMASCTPLHSKGQSMKNTSRSDEPLPRYKLSNFQPGDILLSTVPRSLVATAIRTGTRSRFSHAAMHYKDLIFLEAISSGVCTFNTLVSAVNDKKNVQVLRIKDEHQHALAASAADAAYALIGREYWVEGALRSPLAIGQEDIRGRLFCSYLVAEAYRQVGLDLCPGKEPRFVTPGALSSSPLLHDVTDSVLYEAAEHELRAIVRLIDGNDPTTPQTEFREAIARILSQVRPAYARRGMPTPSSLPHAMALLVLASDHVVQRALDDELAMILENAGYADLPTTVLFRQPVVGFDEQTLSGAPLDALRATISTHRIILRGWCDNNGQRRMGLEQGRQQYGDKLPFKILDIQAQHEMAHWTAMEVNIAALKRNVALMEHIEDGRLRSSAT